MSAGFAMGSIFVMVAKTALGTYDVLFCGDVQPLLDDTTHLPGYKNNT
jgi:hypothetical protein